MARIRIGYTGLCLFFLLPACNLLFGMDDLPVTAACTSEDVGEAGCGGEKGEGGVEGQSASTQSASVVTASSSSASGGGSGGDWGGGGGHVAGTCGDGFLDSGEYCDDGNTDAGDGCGLDCDLEADLGNCASTAPFILNGSQGVSWNARIDAASPLSDHWGCGSSKGRASFATIVSQVAGDVRLEIVAPFDVTLWLGEAACTAPQVGCATFSSQQGVAAGSMTVHFAPHEQRLLKVLAPSNALGAYTIRARYVEP